MRKKIIFGLILIFLVASYLVFQNQRFHLVSAEPSGEGSSVAPVMFTFNRELAGENAAQFSITPSVAGRTTVQDNKVVFEPTDHYHLNTAYTATLKKVTAKDGTVLGPQITRFKAVFIPENQLSESERQAAEERTDPVDRDPLLAKLPYETLHFKVDYAFEGDSQSNYKLTVTLYAILNDPSQQAEYRKQLVQYKQEALAWLTSQGVEAAKQSLTFTPNPDQ